MSMRTAAHHHIFKRKKENASAQHGTEWKTQMQRRAGLTGFLSLSYKGLPGLRQDGAAVPGLLQLDHQTGTATCGRLNVFVRETMLDPI